MGDLEEGRHRSRAATDRASLVAVPALPGRGDPGAAFFTADLLDGTQAYVLAVIEHASRRIRILGVTPHPTGAWTAQQARNLLMDLGEQTHRVKFMIRDRGPDFTAAFDAVLADSGIPIVLCNVRTPRMNAIAGRWIGGCRRELLDRTLVWNQAHLRRILRE
jgi:putative transposase